MQKNDDATRLLDHRQRQAESWISAATFPDPTYDHESGWKLDQFAMAFEPLALRRLKVLLIRDLAKERRHGFNPLDVWDLEPELIEKIKARYLSDRFQVTGFPIGHPEAMVVPRPLLEVMSPDIILSELCEYETGMTNLPQRRFEHVRIFDLAARKSIAGRESTYD